MRTGMSYCYCICLFTIIAIGCASHHRYASDPPDTDEISSQDAKAYIGNYINAKIDRFCVSYTIDKAYMDALRVREPFVHAVRVYNGYADPVKPLDRRMIVHPLYVDNNGFCHLINGTAIYYGDEKNNNISDETNPDQTLGVGSLQTDVAPTMGTAGIAIADYRLWYKNYYRHSANYQGPPAGTKDKYTSFVIKLRADFYMVAGAGGVRIFHGLNGSDRVLILVGVDAAGAPLWNNAIRVTTGVKNLCPEECDFF